MNTFDDLLANAFPTGTIDFYGRLRVGSTPDHLNQLAAAEAAGFSAVLVHPCEAELIDSASAVEDLLRHVAASKVTVYPVGALTAGLAGEGLTAYAKLKSAGCVAVGQGDAPLPAAPVLRRAFEYAASCNMPIILRAEDAALAANGFAHEGAFGTKMGLKGIPVMAETIGLNLLLTLADQTGARLHVSRLSSAAAVEQLRQAQQQGSAVTADVAVANLLFIDENIGQYNSEFHVQPVLRSDVDRQALKAAVTDGTIAAVCSNHQAQSADSKLAPFPQTEPGMSLWPTWLNVKQGLNASQ